MKAKYISIILLLFIGLLFLSGCSSSKKTITLEEFQNLTEKNEYVFSNVTEQFDYDPKIKEAGMASTTVWHVEYYILDTKENAEDMFETNRIEFQKTMISTSNEKYQKTKKYRRYQLTTSYEFMYLYQVDHTLLFARAPVEYRSKILNFVKKIEE